MVKLQSIGLGFILLILVSACTPQAESVSELPTLAQFPTETETAIPSETPIASDTATSTSTATETPTTTHTPTETHTPTTTSTASLTPLPSATVTASQTFTPTPTDTPEASSTPIPTRTPDAPVIETFEANTTTAANGAPITLRWVAQADATLLEVLDSNGNIIQAQDVSVIGTFSSNTPSTGSVVTYRLIAIRGTQEVRAVVSIDMAANCPNPWYFSTPPSSAGCPLAPVQAVQVTFQQFNSGFMFRTIISGNDRTCGVQTDRNLYSCYESQPYNGTPPATPMPDRFEPDPLLAHSFYNNLATGGFWYDIIGFGTQTATTVNAQQQVGTDDGRLYLQLPNGIYAFDSSLNSQGAAVSRVNNP